MGNAVVFQGKGVVQAALFAAALSAALLLAPAVAVAAGNTYFASPGGTGKTCSTGTRCSINEAVAKAGNGDAVSLAAGAYELPPLTGLTLDKQIDFGAPLGETAVLETAEGAGLGVTTKAKATLHDLRIEGEGGLQLGSGAAERIFVAYVGVAADACELDKGTTLRNSVCWTRDASDEEEGVSHAIGITSSGENQDELVVLRNVTAIAQNEDGNAINLLGAFGAELTVDAANVIARSENGVDIVAAITGGGFPKAFLNIVNSDFGEFVDDPIDATVTPLGTSGNIGAAPAFVDAAAGNFHVGADSPTLDGGVSDPSVGSFDLEGHDRAQSKCFGAAPLPDMGAFERTPTANCPPVPPPSPPRLPAEPRKPIFRVLSLQLNKRTGGGRLLVEVPEAGTLSLTGSGVKLVRRTAPAGGGVISLPIQAWAITRVRLAKTGKTKVHLKVTFDGRAGGVERWAKAVQLRKKIS